MARTTEPLCSVSDVVTEYLLCKYPNPVSTNTLCHFMFFAEVYTAQNKRQRLTDAVYYKKNSLVIPSVDTQLTTLIKNDKVTITENADVVLTNSDAVTSSKHAQFLYRVYLDSYEYIESETELEHFTHNAWVWKNQLDNNILPFDKYVRDVVLSQEQREKIAKQIENKNPIESVNSIEELVRDDTNHDA